MDWDRDSASSALHVVPAGDGPPIITSVPGRGVLRKMLKSSYRSS
jgi:hypothetical protein